MTADVRKQGTIRRPETGWAKARRRRGNVRTCVATVTDGDTAQAAGTAAEGNIVRGED
ncbi:hypothetical protein [Streptomyces sp. NPDC058272]|uniref:hypothetical protein n=1 Tax=Streptomyces sp. NPDC058272 TaxID=3346415 RepID=UPI0036E27150